MVDDTQITVHGEAVDNGALVRAKQGLAPQA
jgi:hypothetical protein